MQSFQKKKYGMKYISYWKFHLQQKFQGILFHNKDTNINNFLIRSFTRLSNLQSKLWQTYERGQLFVQLKYAGLFNNPMTKYRILKLIFSC